MPNTGQGTSDDTKTLVAVLLLIFIYPVGVIVMWFWTHWPIWVKLLISVLGFLFILVILAPIVLIVLNPAGKVAQANNVQRKADVTAIINGVEQYVADHKGQLPPNLPTQGGGDINSVNAGAAFCNALVPTYIAKLPADPVGGNYTDCNSYDTNYNISVSTGANGVPQVTISAPNAQLNQAISVTR